MVHNASNCLVRLLSDLRPRGSLCLEEEDLFHLCALLLCSILRDLVHGTTHAHNEITTELASLSCKSCWYDIIMEANNSFEVVRRQMTLSCTWPDCINYRCPMLMRTVAAANTIMMVSASSRSMQSH